MPKTFKNGFALLIGVSESEVDGWALPDVDKDITAMRNVLTDPNRCAYPPDNVKVIQGKDATQKNIVKGLRRLAKAVKDAGDDATAVFYYSGHGWRDSETDPQTYYFIPYDVDEDLITVTALSATAVADLVDSVAARRLLVLLDCCHAGGMGVKGVDDAAPRYRSAGASPDIFTGGPLDAAKDINAKGLEQLSQGQGRAALSSSSNDQLSYMRSDGAMSIFTYHVIEALTGHAEPKEGATEVLVTDLMGHVHRRVPESAMAQAKKVQEPQAQLTGNFPVALLLGGKGLAKGQTPPDPLDDAPPAKSNTPTQPSVDTGGGAYIGGNVSASGDFVGRDKVVHGDVVHGDKVGGDKVKGDKLTVGNVSGTGIAIGRNASASVQQGSNADAIAQALTPVLQAIQASGANDQAQADALAKLDLIAAELDKGEQENDRQLAGLVQGLTKLVPGAVTAVVSAFGSPILAGLAGPVTKFVLDGLTPSS